MQRHSLANHWARSSLNFSSRSPLEIHFFTIKARKAGHIPRAFAVATPCAPTFAYCIMFSNVLEYSTRFLVLSSLLWIGLFLCDGFDLVLPFHLLPKTVSRGSQPSVLFLSPLFQNLLLSLLLPLQHSIMAHTPVPYFFSKISFYMFDLLSTLAVFLTFTLWVPMPNVLFSAPKFLIPLVSFGPLLGIALLFSSIAVLSTTPQPKDDSDPRQVNSKCMYGMIRHPIMTAFFIMLWSFVQLTESRLILSSVWTLYVLLAVPFLEEPKLRADVGDKVFDAYKEKVPRRYLPEISCFWSKQKSQ